MMDSLVNNLRPDHMIVVVELHIFMGCVYGCVTKCTLLPENTALFVLLQKYSSILTLIVLFSLK